MNKNLPEHPSQILVGANIEQIRIFKKKSIKEIAAALQLTVSAYRNIERGKADIYVSKLFRIAAILEVNFLQFFEIDFYSINGKNNLDPKYNDKNKQLQDLYISQQQKSEEMISFLKKRIEVLEDFISNSQSRYFDLAKVNKLYKIDNPNKK